MGLARRLHAEPQNEAAVTRKLQESSLGRRTAGMLEEAGETEPTIFAATHGLRAPRRERRISGKLQRLLEERREIAAVIDGADGRGVRDRRSGNEVAAAQRDRVDAAHAGSLVYHALEHIVGLRPAGATVWPERHRVGEHAAHLHDNARNVVHAREAAGEIVGLDMGAERAE